jgi:glycosyltransferase involved in cell wall biosynthesis
LLSVIIPVFNRPRQVLLAVDSVLKQRGVDAEKLEIILVDDHSTPPLYLKEIFGRDKEGGRFKLLRLDKNSGPAAARNAGIRTASGELIAFLDSDDKWLPNKLARQVVLLKQVTAAQPETLHAVTCGFYYQGGFSKRLHGRVPIPGRRLSDFAGGCWFSPGSTVLLRKDSFLRVGPFDERLRSLEDLDWFMRFGELGGHVHVVPHLDVIVLRARQPQKLTYLAGACELIAGKFEESRLSVGERRLLRAYLYLEQASAQFYSGRLLRAIAFALRSWATRFRIQTSVSQYWVRSKTIPPAIADAYDVMRAALPTVEASKLSNCEILFVVYSLSLGGTEKHLMLIVPALLQRGHRVKVYNISGTGDAEITSVLDNAGVDVISPSKLSSQRGDHFNGRPTTFRLLAGTLGLMRTYRLEKPLIVHFYLPRAYIIGGLLGLMASLPRLVMSRRSLNAYQEKHRGLAALERRLHDAMTAIVGNSQKVVEQLRDEEHVPSEKLFLLYNGISTEPFERPFDDKDKRAELGLADETLVLITVANLIKYKGHEELLAAIARIKSELPRNWVLLIVGRDDGIGSRLKKKTRDLGLAEHVRFLGQRGDVPELLRVSEIGLLCSHEEGFSNALLEYMAARLPVVATDVGGNAEAVIDGVTGLLVPAKNPGALARAILHLVHDPAERKRMGTAGRTRVQQNFSLEACLNGYEVLYRSIMDNDIQCHRTPTMQVLSRSSLAR